VLNGPRLCEQKTVFYFSGKNGILKLHNAYVKNKFSRPKFFQLKIFPETLFSNWSKCGFEFLLLALLRDQFGVSLWKMSKIKTITHSRDGQKSNHFLQAGR